MSILELNLLLIIVYAILFLLIFNNDNCRKLFVYLTTIQLILINGFRHVLVGIDTIRYERNFYNVQDFSLFEGIKTIGDEIGYQIAQKIIFLMSNDFNIWLIAVAVFLYIALGKFIYKYSRDYFMSYLLFIGLGFYDFSFTGIRQSIAIIIIIHTYKYIINKNIFKFLVLILIAGTFHVSSLIFLPMYFIAHIKWRNHYSIFLIGIFIVFYFLRNQLGQALTLLYYDESAGILEKYSNSGGIGGLSILIMLIILVGLMINNPTRNKDMENIVLTNIMIISFFIQSLSSFSYLFTRLNMFYLIFIILYIPNILSSSNKNLVSKNNRVTIKIHRILKIILTVAFITYYLIKLQDNSSGILPYYFFWEL